MIQDVIKENGHIEICDFDRHSVTGLRFRDAVSDSLLMDYNFRLHLETIVYIKKYILED